MFKFSAFISILKEIYAKTEWMGSVLNRSRYIYKTLPKLTRRPSRYVARACAGPFELPWKAISIAPGEPEIKIPKGISAFLNLFQLRSAHVFPFQFYVLFYFWCIWMIYMFALFRFVILVQVGNLVFGAFLFSFWVSHFHLILWITYSLPCGWSWCINLMRFSCFCCKAMLFREFWQKIVYFNWF